MPPSALLTRARVPVAGLVRSAAVRVPRAPSPSVARLRTAVTALFVLNGDVFGTWASRVPDVASGVGAGHSALGIALLCLSLGALLRMRITGALSARGPGPVRSAPRDRWPSPRRRSSLAWCRR